MLCGVASVTLAGPAWGQQDPGLQELQRNQQMRQQQQDELQLRMQQQQRSLQNPPADARQQQSIHQLEIEQRQRQQDLHYRQNIGQPPAADTDDEGTRRAKSQIEQERTRQQSEQQLRQFDWQLQQESGRRKDQPQN
jgi:hypothetical protein